MVGEPIGQMVCALWRDSAQYVLEWMSEEDARELKLAFVTTVGILVALDGRVILASERDGHGHLKNFTVIPRNCIVQLQVLTATEEAIIS